MNNPRSMASLRNAHTVLIVAAGASYYYARKSINERRAVQEAQGQRPSEKLDWRSRIEQDEKNSKKPGADSATSPGSSSVSPAPAAGGVRDSEKGPS